MALLGRIFFAAYKNVSYLSTIYISQYAMFFPPMLLAW